MLFLSKKKHFPRRYHFIHYTNAEILVSGDKEKGKEFEDLLTDVLIKFESTRSLITDLFELEHKMETELLPLFAKS